ncbi:MAG TPA: iron-containing alcohol dehydrogenase [Anaerolineaceae bacterium]|jgi:NADP-dependent alcohol dehydrogenase|nr:iron-containing alcohol dehydrogenase [Anaerolineales bacterium]HOG59466.1 iron-containing alcohol dehydrogenase [Anaerolineaceae bacterium]HOR84832.1 iron-containing alcohol dehydrogenase [Anaerolineaceae bacterium]HPL43913.1 iron-containing alcohol dehydrogenase [Anaerolineaceae bacterium]HPY33486.1 iron-containing alcohol dehydrogenase [Anaerolineaceae bacterium]
MIDNFTFYNPTRIVFGTGTIAKINKLIPRKAKVMVLYGGGSIKKNGVYEQVMAALKKRETLEFGGIEPNPDYDTLMQAVKKIQKKGADFLLAVGGGSVIDGVKFVAAAALYPGSDPWDILAGDGLSQVKEALPFGSVLTLPATGSEMNNGAVISRRSIQEKLSFSSDLVFPRFSILDPETTYSLPQKQIRNGLVDAFVHVTEQYLTYPVGAVVQDRQAEAILMALIDLAPSALQMPPDYTARANYMWSATCALNHTLNRGVPQDWATHEIGHELTALYGLDHAETLAAVLPWLLWYKRKQKQAKLLQYGYRVFGLRTQKYEDRVNQTIEATAAFFHSLGMPTTLTAYGIDPEEAAQKVQARVEKHQWVFGEHKDITGKDAAAILRLSR